MHTYASKQCGRWDLKICYQTPVKSSITDILHPPKIAKWGKNGAKFENNSLVTKSAPLNVSNWGSSTVVNEVKKSGNIVYVNFEMTRDTLPLPLNYVLATIPDGFRPSSRLYNKAVTLRNTTRGDDLTGFVNINTDGSITLVSMPQSEVYLNQMIVNLSYIV